MMLKKIILTLTLLKDYVKNVVIGDGVLVGMDATVKWDFPEHEPHTGMYYLSFSKDPIDSAWDDFGVQDDEIFYYLDGIKEALSSVWKENFDGWLIVDGSLVVSTEAE